ncbi:nitrous oxide reductase family maturation protein NosD [Shewanella surugensis]|uniref:Nitrous oxide reductase family maturation protein NosD n=1 Tax=Shewanella surugensis TaxID=212020 RepID=A0ABT0L7R0_9GAMM|nr:nitrous oxide reductase family maturation protein NosD [Shewanella surugensis]MCL1123727.1 nitrous oxide reductase family maturation protein NosD [Shewanella surugensis]
MHLFFLNQLCFANTTRALLFFLILFLFPNMSVAEVIQVTPKEDLQAILDAANEGDTISLMEGVFYGNFIIAKAVTINGHKEAVIDAQGVGNALLLKSGHVVIENLNIINWGGDLTEQNAGIYLDVNVQDIIIRNNILFGKGFGIWLQKGEYIKVIGNTIRGDPLLRSSDRGNGIQLSVVKHVDVVNNDVSDTRDGIYIISSQENVIDSNVMHDLRYGIHYMYSHSNKIKGNIVYQARAGYALMSSKSLIVENNISRDCEDYGILMNFITSSVISHNIIKSIVTKPENKVLGRDGKGFFIYNSYHNVISQNVIENAEIGINLTAGSENNQIFENVFINNQQQVKFVANRLENWSLNRKGNFWSNYLGWDLNKDGIGDIPFKPNDGIDKLIWQYPETQILVNSPAILMLRWIQTQFPLFKSQGIQDDFPMMQFD